MLGNIFAQVHEGETKSKLQKETGILKIKPNRKLKIAAIAAATVLAVSMLVGFAYGNQIIQRLGGGKIETGKDSASRDFASISSGFEFDPAEVRDGQIYFILDGSDTNITSYCSETAYYQYEQVTDDGYQHIIIVGGTVDNIGWAEFVLDTDGGLSGSNATYNSVAEPQWLTSARQKLVAQ
jgi:hypothetical protein